jgi:hypothetical protein
VVINFVILFLLAGIVGASALVLFQVLGRVESRAHWGRDAGIARSRRLERRAFVIGVLLLAAMVGGVLAMYLLRTPSCKGNIVIVKGPDGEALECLCVDGRRGACFPPGP